MKQRARLSALRAPAFLSALFVAISLSSCSRNNEDTSFDLRVMTFNIRYGTADDGDNSWRNRDHLVIDVIREFAPDVLGLQEALRFQLDEVMDALGGYREIGVGRDDGVESGEYAAILYRSDRLEADESGTFWFSDTPEVPGSTSWGNSITRICTWAHFVDRVTGGAFYVYNVHLDHESQPSRERSAELLAARIDERDKRDPVIVTGDFNAGEGNPVLLYLTGKLDRAFAGTTPSPTSPGLRDTYRVVHPDSSSVGTFNAFRGTAAGEKIDAVLVSVEWQVSNAAIIRTGANGKYPSDHFPAVAVISDPAFPSSPSGGGQ